MDKELKSQKRPLMTLLVKAGVYELPFVLFVFEAEWRLKMKMKMKGSGCSECYSDINRMFRT